MLLIVAAIALCIILLVGLVALQLFPLVPEHQYDYVIVGSGPAGCVLANRLSADPAVTVCLIEAGSDCCREPKTLPLDSDTILAPEISGRRSHWPDFVRKGITTLGTANELGFHSWQWLPRFRDAPDSRGCYYSRGSNLGGSTTHSQIWIRGDTNDHDRWDTLLGYGRGDSPWNRDRMRRLYQLIENRGQANCNGLLYYDSRLPRGHCFGFDPAVHSRSGMVDILVGGDPAQYGATIWVSPLASAILSSATTLANPLFNLENPAGVLVDESHPLWEDRRVVWQTSLNSQDQLGAGFSARNPYRDAGARYPPGTPFGLADTVVDFQRSTAATAYIYPVQETRPNLTVLSKTYVTRVTMAGNMATGVAVLRDGYNVLDCGRQRNTALAGYGGTPLDARVNAVRAKRRGTALIGARREVILCAGVYNSPHLLLLSGIGPRSDLESLGITVVADRPGVGTHLIDHPELDFFWRTDDLAYDAMSLGAGSRGYYDTLPTTRIRSHSNHPVGSRYGSGPIDDYDCHYHSAVGFVFTPMSGGIANWASTGRPNVRRVGPPTYFANSTNDQASLPQEIPYSRLVWSVLEVHKYTESEGSLRLTSPDATRAPEIVTNWLHSPVDQERHIGAFYNNLWPTAEGMRRCDFVLDQSQGLVTRHQGHGSWFAEWVWPGPEVLFDRMELATTIVSNGAEPRSTVTVRHPGHGLAARYNGTTANDPPSNRHYLRLTCGALAINDLVLVEVLDADSYRFEHSRAIAAGTYGTGEPTGPVNLRVLAFNRERYLQFLLENCWGHHASGTCRMGLATDPAAVVDEHCRVIGTRRLRVVDCSVSPVSHSANTQTASYLYGESVAELILDAGL